MVTYAMEQGLDVQLMGIMKKAARDILNATKKHEEDIKKELNSEMSRWILEVASHKKMESNSFGGSGGASGFGGAPGFGGGGISGVGQKPGFAGINGLNYKDMSPAALKALQKLGMNVGATVDEDEDELDGESEEDDDDDETIDAILKKHNRNIEKGKKAGGNAASSPHRIRAAVSSEDHQWARVVSKMIAQKVKKVKRRIEDL
jgi:hypothetical protein